MLLLVLYISKWKKESAVTQEATDKYVLKDKVIHFSFLGEGLEIELLISGIFKHPKHLEVMYDTENPYKKKFYSSCT